MFNTKGIIMNNSEVGKALICQKCNKEFKQRYLHSDGKKYSLQRRKFCLECSPFKQHNTKDLTKQTIYPRKKNGKYIPLTEMPLKFLDTNWLIIQSFYDSGKTWREIGKIYQIPFSIISLASKLGLFKSRKCQETNLLRNPSRKGPKMKEETKQKLRIARLEYLSNNPESCSWKRSDKFKSIPCESVKDELIRLNIKFESEFQPLLHIKRFFSIDISFPEKKIGFEINGGQHYDTNSQLKPYYQTRHDLIQSEGWVLYEIPYHVAMRKGFVNDFIVPILNGLNPKYDLTLYQKNGAPR